MALLHVAQVAHVAASGEVDAAECVGVAAHTRARERSNAPLGGWGAVASPTVQEGQDYRCIDSEVAPGERYYYRVAWLESSGDIVRALRKLEKSGVPIADVYHELNHWQ